MCDRVARRSDGLTDGGGGGPDDDDDDDDGIRRRPEARSGSGDGRRGQSQVRRAHRAGRGGPGHQQGGGEHRTAPGKPPTSRSIVLVAIGCVVHPASCRSVPRRHGGSVDCFQVSFVYTQVSIQSVWQHVRGN